MLAGRGLLAVTHTTGRVPSPKSISFEVWDALLLIDRDRGAGFLLNLVGVVDFHLKRHQCLQKRTEIKVSVNAFPSFCASYC